MNIFKKFLVICMHVVSLWAFKCLFKFLVASSNPDVMLPVQATIFMLVFYGGLTLMTVFYWIAYFNKRKQSVESILKNNVEITENNNADNTVTDKKINESKTNANIDYEKIIDNVKTLFQNNSLSMLIKILKVVLILIGLIGLIMPSFIVDLAPEFWCARYDGYVVARITSIVILIIVLITHIFKKENIVLVLRLVSIPLLVILLLSGVVFGIFKPKYSYLIFKENN